jgi:hypothetical protein
MGNTIFFETEIVSANDLLVLISSRMYWLKPERELWGTGHTQPAREGTFKPKKSINWHRDKIKVMQMII